ncbi:hypothetical protein C8T65DRAFT_31906 [Cerioporus squamosus]|nr:hypothetical protein C8T65DRAFT_31906 [Cerioporus squamosus]
MKRYIPAPSSKPEPKALSTVQWSGALRPERPGDAKEAVATFKSWLKGVDNEDNEASPWDGVGYTVAVTANRTDPADKTKQRADLALYPACAAPAATEPPKWSAVEVFIECKPESVQDDPFDDDAEDFQPSSERRKSNLGQILSYASLVVNSQHRQHQYGVILFGDMARILRWDYSGIIATKKLNYREEPSMLGRFFWRLCHLSAAQRGHDPTVEQVDSRSTEYALMCRRAEEPMYAKGTAIELGQHARLLFSESLKAGQTYKIRTRDDEGERCFLVGTPHFSSSELAGRGTRGYVAIDCSKPNGPFVYLKDAWRVDHDGMEREGDVLRYLNEEKIDKVPTLVCHSDVEDQVTDSQEVWKLHHPGRDDCPLKKHRHYRLVVQEVGLSMSRFKNARELLYLLVTCIEAHRDAYKKGVIHRDISAGNVLIQIKEKIVDGRLVQQRVGLLTDWELSKRTSAPNAPRQPDRTGTWQFMSAFLLDNPFSAISIPDEVEAFFHILLFYVIRFLPHNCPDVGRFIHTYFNGYQPGVGPEEYYCGQHKQMAMISGRIMLSGGVELDIYRSSHIPIVNRFLKAGRHPIGLVFDALLKLFKARYTLLANPTRPVARSSASSAPDDEIYEGWFAGYNDSLQEQEEEVLTSETWDDIRKQALKLEAHNQIIVLLGKIVADSSLDWPMEDKIADQLRADYNPKKDRVGTPSEQHDAPPTTASQGAQTRSMRTRSLALPPKTASGSSQKRFLARDVEEEEEEEEDEDEARATKRYRSNGNKPSGAGAKKGKGKGRRS